MPNYYTGNTCWTTCTVILSILLALMVAALVLMLYCVSEIIMTNTTSNIRMSKSEVYRVNERYHNMSFYTSNVCIEEADESLENVNVYLQHGSCSDVSTTIKSRTIEHSFSDIMEAEKLAFYWIKNTNFSFNVTVFSHQEPGNFTIYVFKHNYDDASDDCTDNDPPQY